MRAGIEAGGTKFVCAVGSGPDDLVTAVVPTTAPDETLGRVVAFLREQEASGDPIDAIGVASFGPVDLHRGSPTYGHITTTPKPGWAGTDVVGTLTAAFDVPTGFDTDVNGAALAEHRWGGTAGLSVTAYVTVGTGIGGGATIDGRPLHGLVHPEMGHVTVRRHPDDDFAGHCPFHADCLEGLASGPALQARFGRPADDLGPDLPDAVALEGWYLAQLVATIACILSPERISLGGGVLGLPGLLPVVRSYTLDRLGGALRAPRTAEDMDGYLVAPRLGRHAGVLGALLLAEQAAAGHP